MGSQWVRGGSLWVYGGPTMPTARHSQMPAACHPTPNVKKKEHAQLLERQQKLKHVAAETALNLKRQEDEIARRKKEHQETTFKLKRLEEETAQKERKQQLELVRIQREHSELLQKQKDSHSEEFDHALRENEARLKLAETNLSVLKLQHEEALNTQEKDFQIKDNDDVTVKP